MSMLVERLNQAAATWWAWAWQATAQGAILLGLVLAVLALWRRATPPLRYGLLLLVLVKFLLPPVVSSSVGLFAWLPLGGLGEDASQQTVTTTVWSEGLDGQANGHPDATVPVPGGKVPSPRLTAASWALVLQGLGSAAFLAYIAFQARVLRKHLRASRRLEAGPLHRRADTIAQRMGLGRTPGVFLSAEAASPQSGGIVTPFVIFPKWAETLECDEGDILIAHELAHVQRRDGMANWFQALAQALLWWNPAVWWLNARIRAERELCCDDLVLAHGVAEGPRYSHMLVNVAERLSTRRPALAVMAMADSFRHIDQRVRRALDPQPKRLLRMSFVSVVGLLAMAACVLPGAPDATEDDVALQDESRDAPEEPAPLAALTHGVEMSAGQYTLQVLHADRITDRDDTMTLSGQVQLVLTSDREGAEDIEISADHGEFAHAGPLDTLLAITLAGKVHVRREELSISSDRTVIDWADQTITFGEAAVLMRGQDDALTAKSVILNLADGSLSINDGVAESLRGLVEKKAHVRIDGLVVEIDRDADLSLRELLDDAEAKQGPSVGLAGDFERRRAEVAELVSQGKAAIIASPVFKTMEGQQAEWASGRKIPYMESGEVAFAFAGIRLGVMPHVVSTADDISIVLVTSLKVTKEDVEEVGVPIVSKREMETTMTVRSGQAMATVFPSAQEEERPYVLLLTAELVDRDDKTE